jgi:hypothetical protein
MSAVLQFFYEIAEASAQHASGSRATKQTTQPAREQVAQAPAGLGTRGCCTWLAAKQPAQNVTEPTGCIASI